VSFGLLGLLLAGAIIAAPVYICNTDQDYAKMFPVLKFGRQYLAKIAGGDPHLTQAIVPVVGDDSSSTTEATTRAAQTPGETYK
jgi:hypothetical protein